MAKRYTFGGTIYDNNGRYWWKVQMPGDTKRKSIPLKPPGYRYPTKNHSAAQALAQKLWDKAVLKAAGNGMFKFDSVNALCDSFNARNQIYYRRADGSVTTEPVNIELSLRKLRELFGDMFSEDFGLAELKQLRDSWLAYRRPKKNANGKNEMVGLSRAQINRRISHVKRMFHWACGEELALPPAQYAELALLPNLKPGRSAAIEHDPVGPIAKEWVYKVLPYLSDTVAAMVQIQLLTGMRSGELVIIRPCDIDMTKDVWLYCPAQHKNMHRGHNKMIPLGPESQKILQPFINRKIDAYCFSPAEVMADYFETKHQNRITDESCGNNPGSNRVEHPAKKPRDHYDSGSYRNAVQRGIRLAQKDDPAIPFFNPHQLRHTAATEIRSAIGRDAALAVLGQKNQKMIDLYAEIDFGKAVEAARKMG